MQITTLWRVTLRAVQDWWNDNCLRLAASLAYYTALSLAPVVLLIVGVVGLVLDVLRSLGARLDSPEEAEATENAPEAQPTKNAPEAEPTQNAPEAELNKTAEKAESL